MNSISQPSVSVRHARQEVYLWAVVPAIILVLWMYAFPTEIREYRFTVFNSWASLASPLFTLCAALAIRLYFTGGLRLPAGIAVVAGIAVWWVLLAALLKTSFLRVLYVGNAYGVM